VLRLEKISKIYPTGEVLKDVSWEIRNGERIGLVGVNGAGKSTQLKIIAGLEEATDGSLISEGDPSIAYLKQEFDVDLSRTVREELFEAFKEASDLLHSQKLVQENMESELASKDLDYLDLLIKELSVIQSKFESINGYDLESKVEKLLPTIGFNQNEADRLVGDFSGGWQMRIALGKILLQSPDLLLLDEPTNHLDLETIEWLENYLLNQKIAMVIVSHDRSFLDKICTRIVNTERGKSKSYLGNYTSYLQQKDFELESTKVAYEKQQKDLQVQKAYIERFRASATRSTQAKSREKLLDKVEKIEAPENSLKGPTFKFMDAPRAGKDILNIKDLTHSYEDNILFLGAELDVEPNERIAYLGANGSGKSTLIKLLLRLYEINNGSISYDSNDLKDIELSSLREKIGLVSQDVFLFEGTVIDNIAYGDLNASESEVWNAAQKSEADAFINNLPQKEKTIVGERGQKLSGGQRQRISIARAILKNPEILILDEATSSVDNETEAAIQRSLDILKKDRTVIVIAHRLSTVRNADIIYVLENGSVVESGNHESLLDIEGVYSKLWSVQTGEKI